MNSIDATTRDTSATFLFRREHDYRWDGYDVFSSRGIMKTITEDVCRAIREDLLPEIGLFADFSVAHARGLDDLGRYVNGTWSHPCIVLGADRIRAFDRRHGEDLLELTIETTITHELWHAIQEINGTLHTQNNACENEAEAFARTWYEQRIISAPFQGIINEIRSRSQAKNSTPALFR